MTLAWTLGSGTSFGSPEPGTVSFEVTDEQARQLRRSKDLPDARVDLDEGLQKAVDHRIGFTVHRTELRSVVRDR